MLPCFTRYNRNSLDALTGMSQAGKSPVKVSQSFQYCIHLFFREQNLVVYVVIRLTLLFVGNYIYCRIFLCTEVPVNKLVCYVALFLILLRRTSLVVVFVIGR